MPEEPQQGRAQVKRRQEEQEAPGAFLLDETPHVERVDQFVGDLGITFVMSHWKKTSSASIYQLLRIM